MLGVGRSESLQAIRQVSGEARRVQSSRIKEGIDPRADNRGVTSAVFRRARVLAGRTVA